MIIDINLLKGKNMSEVEFPVLDLEPYFNGEADADIKLAEQLKEVCETIGFFFLNKHFNKHNFSHLGWTIISAGLQTMKRNRYIFSIITSILQHKLICTYEFRRDFLFYVFRFSSVVLLRL